MCTTLQKHFGNFSESLLQNLEANGSFHDYKAGTILIKTGQYISTTTLLLEGKIKIYRQGEDGGEFLMYYLNPGQACAISMICATKEKQSQIMAKVVEDAKVLSIPLQLMNKLMTEHSTWSDFVIQTYKDRFDEMLEVVDNIAFRSMDERIEFYLKRHATSTQSKLINLSHQEIANDLNTSREVVSRLLKKMEQRGLLKLNRNQIELLT